MNEADEFALRYPIGKFKLEGEVTADMIKRFQADISSSGKWSNETG